jgi:serine/threonine protein kinase
VVRRLSAGGHGTIYLVRNRDLPAEKRYALKILNSSLGENADLNRRLISEAHLQACIDHPNVVAVHDAGTTGEHPPRAYLVMERLRGHSLKSAIDTAGANGLGLTSICGIGIEVCDALACAHDRGAIHRDIKPDNIFLHTGLNDHSVAVTKVLDFGVAYFIGGVHRRTDKAIIGAPQYMSPEQFRGERPSPRTDLYAVGLVLYEMVTGGQRPFTGNNLGEISDAHLHKPPPPPSSKVDFEVPETLEALIMHLLEKEPSARPANARVVGSRLREIKHAVEAVGAKSVEDITRTHETPLENMMIMSRVAETGPTLVASEANENPTLPGTPKAKAEPGLPAKTVEEVPVPFQPTLPSGAANALAVTSEGDQPPPAEAPKGIDRNAVTRTLDPPKTPKPKTDTMRLFDLPAGVQQVGDRLVAIADDEHAGDRPSRPMQAGERPSHPVRPASDLRRTPDVALIRPAWRPRKTALAPWQVAVGTGAGVIVLLGLVFLSVHVAASRSVATSTSPASAFAGQPLAIPEPPPTAEVPLARPADAGSNRSAATTNAR